MSRRFGSSKATPTPLSNDADKGRQKNERKEVLTARDWKKSSAKVIAMPPTTGEGEDASVEKRKVNTNTEKKKNTEYAKNHLNPAHNSGNVSCATNEWRDYPDQPRH